MGIEYNARKPIGNFLSLGINNLFSTCHRLRDRCIHTKARTCDTHISPHCHQNCRYMGWTSSGTGKRNWQMMYIRDLRPERDQLPVSMDFHCNPEKKWTVIHTHRLWHRHYNFQIVNKLASRLCAGGRFKKIIIILIILIKHKISYWNYTNHLFNHILCLAWSSHYKKDKKWLERIKHFHYRIISSYKELTYEKRLNRLGISTLEEHRNRSDLLELFKMHKGLNGKVWNHVQFSIEHSYNRSLSKTCDDKIPYWHPQVFLFATNNEHMEPVESRSRFSVTERVKNRLNKIRLVEIVFFIDECLT